MADYWNQAKYWAGQSPRLIGGATLRRLPPRASTGLMRILESQARPRDLDVSSSLPRARAIVTQRTIVAPGQLQLIEAVAEEFPEDGHWYPALEVFRLTGVELDVDSGLVFSQGWVVNESGVGWRWAMDSAVLSGASFRVRTGPRRDETAPVAALGNVVQIYHFLAETLPAVLRVRQVNPATVFVTSQQPMPLAREILARLGVDYRILESGTVLHCATMLLCPGQPKDRVHPADAELLRTTFATEPAPGRELVYISRRKSTRQLDGEPLLEDHLRERGFAIVLLEDLPFEEQVATFTAARVVVAPHGAGLANIVFMRPGGRVVEIATGELWTPVFRRLAHLGDHDYDLLLVDSVGTSEFGSGRADQAIAGLAPHLERLTTSG